MADLVVDQVRKEFPTRGEPLVVLSDVSLTLSAGETAAIIGPSGSGKTTLLTILGTLDSPTSGTLSLGGEDPFSLSEPDLAEFRNRRVGFVFQDHHLLPQLSVLENVLVPCVANGKPDTDTVDRAHWLIDQVGLKPRIEHRPAELSGGERQRVAVARALICKPLLLLADEPTGNLDRTNALGIGQLLLDMRQQENTMLIAVTHSLELALLFGERYELDDGQLKREIAS